MKTFYAIIVTLLVSMTTTAVTAQALPGRAVKKVPIGNAMNSLVTVDKQATRPLSFTEAVGNKVMAPEGKSAGKKAPRKATPLITMPPEGTVKYYKRSGSAYQARNYGNTPQAQTGMMTIVFCDNNEVYMLNPLCYATTDTYVKGTLEGNTITVPLPQTIYNFTGYNLELGWLDVTPFLSGVNYYNEAIKVDRTNTSAVFTIGDDGSISLQGSSSSYVLAGVYDDDDMWYGAADFETVYTETTLEETITPPDGITPVSYYYKGSSYYSSESHDFTSTVNVVKDGNDIYFQGLTYGDPNNPILPQAWAKGTLSDNKVTIPMGQYMGLDNGSPIYLVGYVNNAAGDITFTYDAEAETFTLDNIFFVNGKNDAVYYYTYTQPGALITLTEPEPEPEPELVVVPETATIEDDWTIEATFNTNGGANQVNKATQVAFDGNDVYIQGIPYYFASAWMKGTISGNTATFASGQFVGSDSYGNEFMVGYDGSALCDIVFNYDSDAKVFTLVTPYIAENQEVNTLSMWGYYNTMTVYKGAPEVPEVVEVPEGLETLIYIWTGKGVTFDSNTNEPVYTDFTKQINIGFDGNDVYVQGLSTDLSEAWVKGTVNGTTATFATGQYFGTDDRLASWGYTYPHYFTGYGNGFEDVVFTFNPETGVFTYTEGNWIIDNEYKNTLSYYLIFAENVWTPYVEEAGKPATPEILAVNLTSSYPSIQLSIPLETTDGKIMNANKVFYRLFTDVEHDILPLAFTPDDYENISETMYEIPYTFDDDWDIYEGGSRVYLNQDREFLNTVNRIGVQVVYYGGMNGPAGLKREPADNESEVIWFTVKDYNISTGITDAIATGEVKSVRYYNAAGLSSTKPFDGMNIVVKKMSDGTTAVEKVMK